MISYDDDDDDDDDDTSDAADDYHYHYVNKQYVNIWMLCRVALGTQMVKQRINSEV